MVCGAAAVCLVSAYVWFAVWPALVNWVRVFLSPELLESKDYVGLWIHVSFNPCGCRVRFENSSSNGSGIVGDFQRVQKLACQGLSGLMYMV